MLLKKSQLLKFKEYSANTDVAEVSKSLEKLHGIFNELDEGSITKNQMEAITKEIFEVRTGIVK